MNDHIDILPGSPSDDVPGILATGHGDIGTLYVSMSARHPEGRDADYLQWHTLDHRPEQYRLSSVRAALRFVSTPACRAARAATSERFEPVDHLMTYFFTDMAGLKGFGDLAVALAEVGRMPYLLPSVERGAYAVIQRIAAPRIKAGAQVLPWWPATGLYLLVENGEGDNSVLLDVAGVGGVWSARAVSSDIADAPAGQRITYCFLDEDPVDTARALSPVLASRWAGGDVKPLLAAPFELVVPRAWDRYLPG